MLGHPLSKDARGSGKPSAIDAQDVFTTIDRLHHARDKLRLFVCHSGRRSRQAAQLLGCVGYGQALPVAGGLLAWKQQQAGESSAACSARCAWRRVAARVDAWRPRVSTHFLQRGDLYICSCLYLD